MFTRRYHLQDHRFLQYSRLHDLHLWLLDLRRKCHSRKSFHPDSCRKPMFLAIRGAFPEQPLCRTVDHLCQEKRRRETESLMADRDGQLRHLRERLGTEEKERRLQQYGGIRHQNWSIKIWYSEIMHRCAELLLGHEFRLLMLESDILTWYNLKERAVRDQRLLQYEGDLRDSKLEKSEVRLDSTEC